MEDAVSAIVSSGIPGALLVVLGVAYWRLSQQLSAVQEARVTDAKKVAEDALEREEKWLNVLKDLTGNVARLTESRNHRP